MGPRARRIASMLAGLAPVGLCALIATCATGPKLGDAGAEVPDLAADMGRIFFYREGRYAGSLLQPWVTLNEERVGQAIPGGVFVVDRPPGAYVAASTGGKVSFELGVGQARYVELFASAHAGEIYRIRPILVTPRVGSRAILDHVLIDGVDDAAPASPP